MQKEIVEFFRAHIDDIDIDSGSGSYPELPDFELSAQDFLDFAEMDLNAARSNHTLVNATSNLKRAVDCQLDYVFSVLNLDWLYREKRLGIARKLGLLEKAGVVRSRSIEKLNSLRNRLEHHYETPKLEDVEVYFDLVAAFVSVLESLIPFAGTSSELRLQLTSGGRIWCEYFRSDPKISLLLEHIPTAYNQTFEVSMARSTDLIADLDNFAYLFKVHMAMRKYYDGVITTSGLLRALDSKRM